jgi:hypothetical protein
MEQSSDLPAAAASNYWRSPWSRKPIALVGALLIGMTVCSLLAMTIVLGNRGGSSTLGGRTLAKQYEAASKVNLAPCYTFCASRPYRFCAESHEPMLAEIAVWAEEAISARKLELNEPGDDELAQTRSGHKALYCHEWCLVGCANAALDNASCTHVIEDQCVDMNTGDNRAYQCMVAGGTGCAIGSPPKRGEMLNGDPPNMTARNASGQ